MTKNNKRYAAMSKSLRENLLKRKTQMKGRKEDSIPPQTDTDEIKIFLITEESEKDDDA